MKVCKNCVQIQYKSCTLQGHTVPSFETIKQRLCICSPQAGLLSLHDSLIFKSSIKDLTTIVYRVSSQMFYNFLWPITRTCPDTARSLEPFTLRLEYVFIQFALPNVIATKVDILHLQAIPAFTYLLYTPLLLRKSLIQSYSISPVDFMEQVMTCTMAIPHNTPFST